MSMHIRCDVCSTTYGIMAATEKAAKQAALNIGWVVIDGKTHCRQCAMKAQQAQGVHNG